MNYREDAREKRKKVIAFAASPMRRFGSWVGVFAALMFVPSLMLSERDARLTCTRDATGAGICEHVVRYPLREHRETFDARELRGARLETAKGKNGPAYRVHLDVGGRDVMLADFSGHADRIAAEREIDDFAHDASARSLDAYVDGQFPLMAGIEIVVCALGAFLAIASLRQYPRRRLVLDETSGLASLERRRLGAWRTEWRTPLADVRGATMEQVGKTWRVVVETSTDGHVPVVEEAREYDPAIETVSEFMRR